MRASGQRITGWILTILFFLLPLKFGSLAMMPEQPPMFPTDLLTLTVISWPPHSTGIAGGLLLMAALLLFPLPSYRAPGGLTALFWGVLLPLAALPGCINATNQDYVWSTLSHWWGIGAFILSSWVIFSADPCWKKRALNALAAGVLMTGIDGWRQYFWGFEEMQELIRKQREAGIMISKVMEIRIMDSRVFSSLGSCNTFAGFLLLTLPAVVLLVKNWGKRFEPVKISCIAFFACASGLLLPCLLMTRSRGAWLCAFAAGGIWFLSRRSVGKKYKIAALLAGVLLAGAAFFVMQRSGRGILSGAERLDYLRSAAVMCTEHPLAGAGWGEFFHRHMKLKLTSSDESARSPHNPAAAFASQAGIPAGIIVLGAFGVLLFELFRRREEEDEISKWGRWGVLAFVLHTFMELNDAIPCSMVCCAAVSFALMSDKNEGEPAAAELPLHYRLAVRSLLLLVGAAGFYLNFRWVRSEVAFEALELAIRPRTVGIAPAAPEPSRVMACLEKVEQLRPRSPYGVEMAGDFFFHIGETDQAERLYALSLARVPGRPAAHRRMALIACARGERVLAAQHLARAREIFPADPKNTEKRFFEDWEKNSAAFRRK